jgi:hypothetical protein
VYNPAIIEGDTAIGGTTAYGCVFGCHQRTRAARFCRGASRQAAARQHGEHASQHEMIRSDRHAQPQTF